MENIFDILVRFLNDKQAQAETEQGVERLAKKLETVKGAFPGDELSQDFEKFSKSFDKAFKIVNGELIDLRTGLKATTFDLRKFSTSSAEDLDKVTKSEKALAEAARQAAKEASAQAAVFSAQAALLNNQVSQARARSAEFARISSTIGQFSGIGLATGIGVIGGIFKAASDYVKNAEKATAVTLEWKEAQESLGKSGQRIGAVLAERALPLLETAARLADKAAGFVEKHPEIVTAALNSGLVLAALGAVGIAVSKGIKLYADQLYLASVPVQLQAARLQAEAAAQQLVAAQLRAEAGGIETVSNLPGPVAAGGGALGNALRIAGAVTLIATSVILGAEIGNALGNAIAKAVDPNAKDLTLKETLFFGGVRGIEAINQKINEGSRGLLQSVTHVKVINQLIDKYFDNQEKNLTKADSFWKRILLGAEKANEAATKLPTGVQASPEFEKILAAYEKYKQEDLTLVQKHYEDRNKIVSDALRAELEENRQYASDVAKVNTNRTSSLIKAAADFAAANEKAERDEAKREADIVREGEESIAKIREASRDRLRKLELEHNERADELRRARDALNLVKENRRFAQARAEERSNTSKEVQERRRETAQRLAEARAAYEQEKADRLAAYQERVQEINREADERLAELAEQHRQEIQKIREQRTARLKELDAQFLAERKRRYDYFVQQIRDLDASLLGESNLRKAYQAQMIRDLDAFLLAYKTKLASLSTSATPAGSYAGGYARYGTYLLGDAPGGGPGKREYIIQGDTTERLEKMIGGTITPEKLMALAMAGGRGGDSKSITYNDSRRISGPVTGADRNRLREDMAEVMGELMRQV